MTQWFTGVLTCVIALSACSPAPAPAHVESDEDTEDTKKAEVGSFQLRLEDCRLRYRAGDTRGAVELDFPKPCDFSRKENGEVRIVEAHGVKTVAIEASRPEGEDCETFIRGVIVDDGQLRLSRQTQNVAACLPAVWDEKMFHVFAAHTVPAEQP